MREITTQQLRDLIQSNEKFILLDCRGVDYYNWAHLPYSVNLRWKYVKDRAEEVLKDKKTLVITSCDGFTCNASVRCFENLKKLGYPNLVEYSGGIADWLANGYPTETNPKYRIAPNAYRFPDQIFYGERVGSYLVEEKDFVLLVDGPQNLTEEHEDFILHFGKPIRLFMTHGPTAGAGKVLQKKYKAKIYLHKADKNNEWLAVKPNIFLSEGFKFNANLTVIHTPGHTPGSSVLFDQKNKIMFTGDHIEGNNESEIYDFIRHDDGYSGHPTERLANAKKLLRYDFEKILPFHYEMILKNAKELLRKFTNKYEHNHC